MEIYEESKWIKKKVEIDYESNEKILFIMCDDKFFIIVLFTRSPSFIYIPKSE